MKHGPGRGRNSTLHSSPRHQARGGVNSTGLSPIIPLPHRRRCASFTARYRATASDPARAAGPPPFQRGDFPAGLLLHLKDHRFIERLRPSREGDGHVRCMVSDGWMPRLPPAQVHREALSFPCIAHLRWRWPIGELWLAQCAAIGDVRPLSPIIAPPSRAAP